MDSEDIFAWFFILFLCAVGLFAANSWLGVAIANNRIEDSSIKELLGNNEFEKVYGTSEDFGTRNRFFSEDPTAVSTFDVKWMDEKYIIHTVRVLVDYQKERAFYHCGDHVVDVCKTVGE